MKSNVQRLIIHKMSVDAIPANGGLMDGIRFLSDPVKIKQGMQAAREWVHAAIAVVKSSPDNPWGDDDEAIAGEILRQIDERKKRKK